MPIRQFYGCSIYLAATAYLRVGTTMYYIMPGGEATMAAPVSVRLDDDVRETLEAEARASHRPFDISPANCDGNGHAFAAGPDTCSKPCGRRTCCGGGRGGRVLRGVGHAQTRVRIPRLAGFSGGQIVIADWRDGLPKEPNKLRPAVVVED